MRKFYRILLLLVVVISCKNAMGESPYYPEGQEPRPTLEEKISRSTGFASTVIVIHVARGTSNAALGLPQSNGFVKMRFYVDDVLKGDKLLKGKELELDLPVTTSAKNTSTGRSIANKELIYFSDLLLKLERDYELKKIDRKEYSQAVATIKERLASSSSYLRSYVPVLVAAGKGDTIYRVACVPVEPGKSYVLMVFNEGVGRKEGMASLAGNFDLYSADQARVLNIVKNIEQQRRRAAGSRVLIQDRRHRHTDASAVGMSSFSRTHAF